MYLDHAATTPLRPQARAAWLAATDVVGNASSIHGSGQAARRLLEDARERLATALGCEPIEVVFTSGGTEAINLALQGLWAARSEGAARIVSTRAEHHATLDTLRALERSGAEVALADVDADAVLDLASWRRALDGHPGAGGRTIAAASLLAANNETGTVQPVDEALAVAADAGVAAHVDAVGAFTHVPLEFARLREQSGPQGAAGLVALSVSAHKIGGPVGVGALVVSRHARLEPLLHGGGHQRGLRAGTQDVAGAVAFAAAAEAAAAEADAEHTRIRALRDRLESGVRALGAEVTVSGTGRDRLPGHVHAVFPGAQGDSLLLLLDMAGIAVSTGSACQAGVPEPSHVVLAMGRDDAAARSALRFTLGPATTAADIDAVLAVLPAAYERARRAGLSSRRVG